MAAKDYLTPQQKTQLAGELYNLHATFATPIMMFKFAKQTVVTDNPNHSFIFERGPTNTAPDIMINSGVCSGRILYEKGQALNFISTPNKGGGGDQINVTMEEGRARIKLDASGAAFMADVTRVTLDGYDWIIDTSPRQHGLFNRDWTTLFLKKVN